MHTLQAQKNMERGYIALMATIIIAAVLLVMSVEGSMAGWHARFNVLGTEAKEQSSALAQGCADQALSAIMTDPSYTGDATTTTDVGTCHVFPVAFNTPAEGIVTIRTQAVVRDSYANLEMQLDMSDIHIDALPEAPTKGTLVIITNVVNDGAGTKSASDFTMHVSGGNPSQTSFPGNESGVVVTVDPGPYGVTEDSVTGYATSVSTNCSGSIGSGDIKFCTVTNDDITTTLTVLVNVVNDNGGTKDFTDFPLFIDGNPATPGTPYTVTAGSHTVSASAVTGYTASPWGYQCSGGGNVTVNEGQNKTCIINMNDVPPPAPSCADTVMILDRTGSMASADLANERAAANSLTDSYAGVLPPALPPHLGVGSIGAYPNQSLPTGAAGIPLLGQLSTIYANVKSAINSITGSNSSVGSDLSAGITVASTELNSVRHVPGNEKVMILVSDGDPNEPSGSTPFDTGFKSPTASVQDQIGNSWIGAAGAYGDGSGDASAGVNGNNVRERYYNFDFGSGAGLPGGSTVNGIVAQIDAWNTTSQGVATTTTVVPTALATYDEWTPNTGTDVSAVGTNDSDTSYIDTGTNVETFTVQNAGVPAGSTINSVTVTAIAKSTIAGGVMQLVTEKGGTVNVGPNITLTTTYTSYTRTMTTDPSTGNPWTLAEVNAWSTKFGVRTANTAATPRVTQFYVTVNYSGTANSGLKVPTSTHTPNNWDTNTVANIQTNNGVYVSDNDNDQQGYAFGATGLGLPIGVTITGIEVIAEAKSSDSGGCQIGAELSSNGSTFTTFGDTAPLTATNDVSLTLGGSNTLWGRSWTPADFNTANFTVRIAGIDPGFTCTNASLTSVDQLQVRVYYTTSASTPNLVPTALATYDEWTPNTGTDVSAVGTNDSDTSYIDTGTNVETFTVANAGIPAGSTIHSVTVNAVAKSAPAGGVIQLVSEKGGVLDIGQNVTLTNSYANYTSTMTTDPSTGNPWTLTEVNAWTTKFGVRTANAGATPRVTQLFVSISYTPPPPPSTCQIGIDLSWNGGASWSNEKSQTLTNTETTYTLGSASDDWANTHTWTPGEFSNTNFRARVRAIDPGSSCDNATIEHLDWLRIKIHYTQVTSPVEAALTAADSAKLAGTNIFTIHFGSDPSLYPGRELLANLASGASTVAGHQNGSFAEPGAIVSGDTNYIAPTTAASTPSQWTNPTRALLSDNQYATDAVNGHLQGFTTFNFAIPPTATITGVAVDVEAKSSDSSGCQVGAELSSNNGTTFTNAGSVTGVSGSDQTYVLGGSTNLWGRTWVADDFVNGHFMVRLRNVDPGNACTNGSTLSVDRLRARVYYSVNNENGDGDNFFISPTSADMHDIFDFIGEEVCPALDPTEATEPPTTGAVTVITEVINNNGGALAASGVTMDVSPGSAAPNSFPGSSSGVAVTLNPGSYEIQGASVPEGYVEIPGAGCSSADTGDIVAGEFRICVVTYDDIPPPPPPPDLSIHLGSWRERPSFP